MPGLVFLILSFLINSINYEQHELTILPNSRNERTFVLIKPDSVQRGYFGNLLSRLEKKGFRLVLMKFLLPEKEIMEEHYEEHRNNPSFDERIQYMLTGPVVASVWEGPGVIAEVRRMLGPTNHLETSSATIRGDFGLSPRRNLCHASDSSESARREIHLWFPGSEDI